MTIRTHTRTRTRTRVLVAAGGTVLLVAGLSGCGSTDVEDAPAEHKSFAYSGKALTIDAENSTVEVVPADVEQIEVTRKVDGWVVLGSGPDPVWKLVGDTLTLRVKCEAMISDCGAQHQVKVPRGLPLTVDADNGRVTASGFGTPLKLFSDNGGVVVRDVSGPLELKSDNGAVRGERLSGASVIAHSDNGSVKLDFSRVPDLVDTVSDNGSVTIDLPAGSTRYSVAASADNGSISVRVPRGDDGRHAVKAHSDNGEVTVRSAN
ncbi:DUF4097 family beta strand repeat-containing protein [Streptomyces sp. NBC_01257]|uniref:DUF4097 family beta strand repeat-containing protein n=1 Tax=Streptomyces sp. NBC_01257 TaxID=2903799 RepID=UPI002DDA8F6F|nr:DUF4097 family beta strand repeat-containing protein [Streptomyces sp. NBC_01257]WRZ64637.1 DUF4097 domain-containing protein [Streptomyces sp. NBC_01257]